MGYRNSRVRACALAAIFVVIGGRASAATPDAASQCVLRQIGELPGTMEGGNMTVQAAINGHAPAKAGAA